MELKHTHHITLDYYAAKVPPFTNSMVDNRLIVEAKNPVNMTKYIFLMEVLPPSLDAPDVLRQGFVTICSPSDIEVYPAGVFDLIARDAIPPVDRFEGMLIYVASRNMIYQLKGGLENADWVIYPSACGSNRSGESICDDTVPVNYQTNQLPYFRTDKIDIAIPGEEPEGYTFDRIKGWVGDLCRKLDYWDAVDHKETVTI